MLSKSTVQPRQKTDLQSAKLRSMNPSRVEYSNSHFESSSMNFATPFGNKGGDSKRT